MTLSKITLAQWEESMRIRLTDTQRAIILARFGSEPEPYEWSEQDISMQIQNFLGWGEFVKPIKDNSNGRTSTLPPGVDF